MFRFSSAVLACALSLVPVADGVARAAGTATPKVAANNITIDPSASKTKNVTESATPTGMTFAGTGANSIVPSSFIDTALRYGDVTVTAGGNVSVNQGVALKNAGASNLLLRAHKQDHAL